MKSPVHQPLRDRVADVRLRWRSYVRRSGRYIAITLGLLIGSCALILWADNSLGFRQSLLTNLGAGLFVVLVTYGLLVPTFEGIRALETREHPALSLGVFIQKVATSRRQVSIQDTWSPLLDERQGYTDRFCAAMSAALPGGTEFRFLLLDPQSAAASERAKELPNMNDVVSRMLHSLRRLVRFVSSLPDDQRNRIHVRIYTQKPETHIYAWDERAFLGFLPKGHKGHMTPHLEASTDSPWGSFMMSRFDALWNDHVGTVDLERYLLVPVTLKCAAAPECNGRAKFTRHEGQYFIVDRRLTEHFLDHGAANFQASIDNAEGIWSVAHVRHTDAPYDAVCAQLEDKYGRHEQPQNQVILQLKPDFATVAPPPDTTQL